MDLLDSKKTLLKHRDLIRSKGILNQIYRDWYKIIKHKIPKKGTVVELGSGAGFIKDFIPRAITTDVIKGPDIDKVINAESLPFKPRSVSAFVMINTFHHIKNPEKALSEMQRCLKKGGKIIMVEPWNNLWSRFIYKNFHHELFDEHAGWKIYGKNRLSDANGALPWIIFKRDEKLINKKFPSLKIESIKTHTPFLYLVSGGLSKPQLVPTGLFSLFKLVETIFNPLGLFAVITLRMDASE